MCEILKHAAIYVKKAGKKLGVYVLRSLASNTVKIYG